MKSNSKQRLFEVIGKIDNSFKPKLNEEQSITNPNYTHYALTKDGDMIVNGWDYNGVEPIELRQYKKDYFFNDIKEMGFDPNNIKVVTKNYLVGSGINPSDTNNWYKSTESMSEGLMDGTGQRPLYQIAREIKQDWGRNVNYAAKPYLDAMSTLESINDNYGMDSGKSIVLYFLSNASSWRGENAKRIKAELKKMAGLKESFASDEQTIDEDSTSKPKPTKFKAVTEKGNIWDDQVSRFIQKMEEAGYSLTSMIDANSKEVISTNPIYDFSWMIGAPKFNNILGPMRDGDFYRYETQGVYNTLSN